MMLTNIDGLVVTKCLVALIFLSKQFKMFVCCIQLFPQNLIHNRAKVYATSPQSVVGSNSLSLLD